MVNFKGQRREDDGEKQPREEHAEEKQVREEQVLPTFPSDPFTPKSGLRQRK